MSNLPLSAESLAFVCGLVRERSAIELEASKSYLIEARLAPLAKQCGFGSTAELIQGVKTQRQSELERRLVEAMTTNETSFFRDQHPFEALRTHIIPELRAARSAQRSLHIWSAACSSGQELYSVAMLLRDHFPDLMTWRLELLGTDLSDEVSDRARAGRFSHIEINRGLTTGLLAKYFQRDGAFWQLHAEVRALTKFRKQNLIDPWYPLPTMDIVFLRNVLIYFSAETKKLILQRVRRVMAPHAVLFLGAAETTMNLDASFERVQAGNAVYYRLK